MKGNFPWGNVLVVNVSSTVNCWTRLGVTGTNIAKIAKAALHKLPGKSSLNKRSVYPPSLVFPVCPVCPGCPRHFQNPVHPDDHL